jgi:hypothetical protein
MSELPGERIGVLSDDEGRWGYLRVHPSCIEQRVGWRWRRVRRPCLVEELFRVRPPKPADDDWADSLGLSDTIVQADELAEEMALLDRNEFMLTGRLLRIAWVDGREAEQIRHRYFAESRW